MQPNAALCHQTTDDRAVSGKPIAESHAHVVAGMGLDHRPRDLPVIAVEISCPAGDAHPAMPGFKIDVHHWGVEESLRSARGRPRPTFRKVRRSLLATLFIGF